jgi:hypothetical protein
MKTYNAILVFAVTATLVYLTGAFGSASFDITTWHVLWRTIVGVAALTFASIFTAAYLDEASKQK